MGALVSALLSSADSALLAPASVISFDILKAIKPDVDDQTVLRVSRLCIPVLGALSLYLAFAHNTVYSLMVNSWSILLATLFVPLTAGIWGARSNTPGCISAMVAGFLSYLVFMAILPKWPADLLAVPVAVFFLILFSLSTTLAPRPLRTETGEPIALTHRFGLN